MKSTFFISLMVIFIACNNMKKSPDTTLLKQEITDTELAFAKMASDSGIAKAFKAYAAPDAVMKRGKGLVMGYDSIIDFIDNSFHPGEKLSWTPDFVDVAASGDLAYTYGKYVFSFPDSSGIIQKQEGYFHTVWKRQPDGNWKFVWD